MYDLIINAIKTKNNFSSDDLLASYLQNLQEPVKALRKSYWSYPVSVDYSKEDNQVAYLITYFPHYTGLLLYILAQHHHDIATHTFSQHYLGLFGGGPCPELIGYLSFLQRINPTKISKLEVVNFDIAADTWAYSRDMNMQHIVPQYKGNNVIKNFTVLKMDITSLWTDVTTNEIPKIAVFQNCLNEPNVSKHPTIIQNFKVLFQALPSKSTIIIIDFANYSEVINLIEKIEKDLTPLQGFRLIRSVKAGHINGLSAFSEPPPMIRDNLLTGKSGLIPRKYITFSYSMIYKE
jgi:hypothetical protein